MTRSGRARAANSGTYRLRWTAALLGVALSVVLASTAHRTPAAAQASTPTATPAPHLFEDNDPYLVYVGSDWNAVSDPKARGGTLHQARAAGSILRMQFSGPYFKWYGVRGSNRGRVQVTVDGTEIAIGRGLFDLYKPGDPSYELIVWQGGLDSEKEHTLVIEVLGERNGASSGMVVDIDAIEVLSTQRAPMTPTPSGTQSPTATPAATSTPASTPASTPTPAGTAVGTATPQANPTMTPGPERPPGSWPIDSRFLRYYVEHDGLRILGNTTSPPTFFAGHFTQYFEKARIEDHTGESPDPNWQFLYGLVVDELQTMRAPLAVGGEVSTLNYTTINQLAQEVARAAPPAGFTGGTFTNADGSVFVPYSQALRPAPGHNISPIFWPYINRADIFPGGWLHDIGLPMTEAMPAVVTKGALANRQILLQVFQRTILTYDPLNPADFQVERANVGTDYRRAFPDRVPQ